LLRGLFLGLMLAVNGAKLGYMVRGMAAMGATAFVAVDLVAGTVTEAAADTFLFSHPPTLRWGTGAALMTAGVMLLAWEQRRAEEAAEAVLAEAAKAEDDAEGEAGDAAGRDAEPGDTAAAGPGGGRRRDGGRTSSAARVRRRRPA